MLLSLFLLCNIIEFLLQFLAIRIQLIGTIFKFVDRFFNVINLLQIWQLNEKKEIKWNEMEKKKSTDIQIQLMWYLSHLNYVPICQISLLVEWKTLLNFH